MQSTLLTEFFTALQSTLFPDLDTALFAQSHETFGFGHDDLSGCSAQGGQVFDHVLCFDVAHQQNVAHAQLEGTTAPDRSEDLSKQVTPGQQQGAQLAVPSVLQQQQGLLGLRMQSLACNLVVCQLVQVEHEDFELWSGLTERQGASGDLVVKGLGSLPPAGVVAHHHTNQWRQVFAFGVKENPVIPYGCLIDEDAQQHPCVVETLVFEQSEQGNAKAVEARLEG